jgi:hypothetical protein
VRREEEREGATMSPELSEAVEWAERAFDGRNGLKLFKNETAHLRKLVEVCRRADSATSYWAEGDGIRKEFIARMKTLDLALNGEKK